MFNINFTTGKEKNGHADFQLDLVLSYVKKTVKS